MPHIRGPEAVTGAMATPAVWALEHTCPSAVMPGATGFLLS